MIRQVPVITIDGPSGSGKGTVAALLAAKLGWNFLDSGALYRLLAFAARNHGVDLTNEEALKLLAAHLDVQFGAAKVGEGMQIILEGEDVTQAIRNEQVGAGASQVAALPVVRDVFGNAIFIFQSVARCEDMVFGGLATNGH